MLWWWYFTMRANGEAPKWMKCKGPPHILSSGSERCCASVPEMSCGESDQIFRPRVFNRFRLKIHLKLFNNTTLPLVLFSFPLGLLFIRPRAYFHNSPAWLGLRLVFCVRFTIITHAFFWKCFIYILFDVSDLKLPKVSSPSNCSDHSVHIAEASTWVQVKFIRSLQIHIFTLISAAY